MTFDLATYSDITSIFLYYKRVPQNPMEFIDSNEWKPIHMLPGFECCIEYYVNKNGQIKSTKGNGDKILKQRINRSGYPQVNLTQRIGRKKTLTVVVHKLVALAFLDSPSSMPGRDKNCARIVHVDSDKTNNAVGNLKWTKIKDSVT